MHLERLPITICVLGHVADLCANREGFSRWRIFDEEELCRVDPEIAVAVVPAAWCAARIVRGGEGVGDVKKMEQESGRERRREEGREGGRQEEQVRGKRDREGTGQRGNLTPDPMMGEDLPKKTLKATRSEYHAPFFTMLCSSASAARPTNAAN